MVIVFLDDSFAQKLIGYYLFCYYMRIQMGVHVI